MNAASAAQRSNRIDWTPRSSRELQCPVCHLEGPKPFVLNTDPSWAATQTMALHACPGCACKFFPDLATAEYNSDDPIDTALKFYIEVGAGLDQLIQPFFTTGVPRNGRYLDIGCGFGFALDFARHALGLECIGCDPSRLAEAGRAQLGVQIVPDYLTETSDLGIADFDLIIGSEVIEHIFEPRRFIAILKRQLAADGVLFMTTPHADAIEQKTSDGALLPLLSTGWHYILYSDDGLTRLLKDAGFTTIVTQRRGNSLIAFATNGNRPIDPDAKIDEALYLSYLASRSRTVPPDSPLQIGFMYRLLKQLTNAGRYSEAGKLYDELREKVQRTYAFDVEAPLHTWLKDVPGEGFNAFGQRYPMCLTGIGYFRGIIALNHDNDPARAAHLFDMAVSYGRRLRRQLQKMGADDGETEDLAERSGWLALRAHAHQAPARVPAGLSALKSSALTAGGDAAAFRAKAEQVFLHLVNLGAYDEALQVADTLALPLYTPPSGPAADFEVAINLQRAFAILAINHQKVPRPAALRFALAERMAKFWSQQDPASPPARRARWEMRAERMQAWLVAGNAPRSRLLLAGLQDAARRGEIESAAVEKLEKQSAPAG